MSWKNIWIKLQCKCVIQSAGVPFKLTVLHVFVGSRFPSIRRRAAVQLLEHPHLSRQHPSLQVSLELPDAGGERRKAWNQWLHCVSTQHDTEAAVGAFNIQVKGLMSRVLSLQDGGGTAGTVNAGVGGVSGLRKCALVSEGRRREERDGNRREGERCWVSGRSTMVTVGLAGFCHWTGTQQERYFLRCPLLLTCRVQTFTRSCSGELQRAVDCACRPPAGLKGKVVIQTFHLSAFVSYSQLTHRHSCGLFEDGYHVLVLIGRLWKVDAAVSHMCSVGRDAVVVVGRCGAANGHQISMNRCGYSIYLSVMMQL